MNVDKMTIDNMTIDKISLDKMNIGKMTIDKTASFNSLLKRITINEEKNYTKLGPSETLFNYHVLI